MTKSGVIITDGNERSALAVTRSLGKRGIPVYVGAETARSLAGASRYCTHTFVYSSPWRDPEDYLRSLMDAATRYGAAVLFPMTDMAMELVGERREKIEKIVGLPISSLAQYHQLSDKFGLTAWAEKAGIPVPPTIFIPDGDVDAVIAQIEAWPVVIKPARSLCKFDGSWRKTSVLYARDADELRKLYHDHWYLKLPSMVQKLIKGHGEGVFGLFAKGEPVRLFAHRRLRERPPSGGVSVLREAIALPDTMSDYALRIMKSADWDGIAMVEFKVDPTTNIPYLMEVNGRFWGSLQLAIDAGVDFPFLLYQQSVGQSKPSSAHHDYRVGIRSRWWLGDLDHLIARLRPGAELSLPPHSVSLWETFSSLINVFDVHTENEILRLSDLRPGMLELRDYAGAKLSAFRRRVSAITGTRSRAVAESLRNSFLALNLHQQSIKRRIPTHPKSVLILCRGNICRSPFAEVWLRRAALDNGMDIRFKSAGLDAVPGRKAYPMAAVVAPKFDLDLDQHRAQSLSEAMVEEADLVIVMEPEQVRILADRFPVAKRKTFVFGHFMANGAKSTIDDPYGGTVEDFERCFEILGAAGDGFIELTADGP